MEAEKYYKVFWSKDVRKKKRSYTEGVVHMTSNKYRLYGCQSELVMECGIRSVYYHNPDNEEEFLMNNGIIVTLDSQITKEDFTTGRVYLPVKSNPDKKKKQVKQQTDGIPLEDGYEIEGFLAKILRPHQVQGVKFMFECLTGRKGTDVGGCILADHMGLGKTIQTLSLLYTLLSFRKTNSKKFKRAIVVSPLTLVHNWKNECNKFLGQRIFPLVAIGDGKQVRDECKKFAQDQYRLLLLSYESFYSNATILDGCCDIIVFDQGHRLKNPKSRLYKAIAKFSCRARILLTGTPIQNSIEEFQTCINIVNPLLFPSESMFNNIFKKPILDGMKKNSSMEQRALAAQRSKELIRRVKDFSLRRRADVLAAILPPKKQYHVFLNLTSQQEEMYEEAIQANGLDWDPLTFICQVRKLLTHPNLFRHESVPAEDQSAKTLFSMQVAQNVKKQKNKVIISSYFTETLSILQGFLKKREIKYERLDGSMNVNHRQSAIQRFKNDQSVTVFLLSSKAGGVGLNLTCANKLIMMEPDWNPSNDHQLMGRVWRDGQKQPVHIYRLIALGTFEEKVLQRQYMKESLSEKLVDDSSTVKLFDMVSMRELAVKRTKYCLTYKQDINELAEVSRWNQDFKECQSIIPFVYIRKQKNCINGVNEFDDDQMFLMEQDEKQEPDEAIQDFGEDTEPVKKVIKRASEEQKEQMRKEVEGKLEKSQLEESKAGQEQIVIQSANKKLSVKPLLAKLLRQTQ